MAFLFHHQEAVSSSWSCHQISGLQLLRYHHILKTEVRRDLGKMKRSIHATLLPTKKSSQRDCDFANSLTNQWCACTAWGEGGMLLL